MKAFLMAGQSNMAGRGDFEEVPELNHPLAFMLRNGRWQPMSEPVNPDRSVVYPLAGELQVHSGVSLAAAFAVAYAEHYGEEVGLIPCADGGSSLAMWMPGEVLFDHAVLQTQLALRTARLAGILWHQGESDSKCPETAHRYAKRAGQVLRGLRTALGAPDIPIILGELGSYLPEYNGGECQYFTVVNTQLHQLAEDLGICTVASAQGLTCRRDHLHFDSRSLRRFGTRYFEAYRTLVTR